MNTKEMKELKELLRSLEKQECSDDIYTHSGIFTLTENDHLDPFEEGFMRGYLNA
ncbi:hypothetical protein K9M79_08945 [Candidatus Woesearchaeota archaeon]|nr:hypothetical protein [Candidatus Woesearchaeota archaeon]